MNRGSVELVGGTPGREDEDSSFKRMASLKSRRIGKWGIQWEVTIDLGAVVGHIFWYLCSCVVGLFP